MQPLDRDGAKGKTKWHLQVTATDGQYNATCEVLVNLKDVNDNPPVFIAATVAATVKENAPAGRDLLKCYGSKIDAKQVTSGTFMIKYTYTHHDLIHANIEINCSAVTHALNICDLTFSYRKEST